MSVDGAVSVSKRNCDLPLNWAHQAFAFYCVTPFSQGRIDKHKFPLADGFPVKTDGLPVKADGFSVKETMMLSHYQRRVPVVCLGTNGGNKNVA